MPCATFRSTPLPDLSDTQVINLYRLGGPGAEYRRRPGYLSITTKDAVRPAAKGGARFIHLRLFVCVCHFEDGTILLGHAAACLNISAVSAAKLPKGVTPSLGPGCHRCRLGVHVSINSTNRDLAELRSYQDWYLKYQLPLWDGVSEVASVGGFVEAIPSDGGPGETARLQPFVEGREQQPLNAAMARSGGRSLELAEREYILRVKGYVQSLDDLSEGRRRFRPERRADFIAAMLRQSNSAPTCGRGIAELNGEGETVVASSWCAMVRTPTRSFRR